MAIDDIHSGSAHHYYAHDSTDVSINEQGKVIVGVFVVVTVILLILVGYQLEKKEREEAQQRKQI